MSEAEGLTEEICIPVMVITMREMKIGTLEEVNIVAEVEGMIWVQDRTTMVFYRLITEDTTMPIHRVTDEGKTIIIRQLAKAILRQIPEGTAKAIHNLTTEDTTLPIHRGTDGGQTVIIRRGL